MPLLPQPLRQPALCWIALHFLFVTGAARADQAPAPPSVPPLPAAPAPAPAGTSLTLDKAFTEALTANPAAAAAAQQLAAVRAKYGQALAQRRFQVSFSTTAGGSNADVIQ